MSAGEPSPEPKPAPRLGSYLLVQPLGSGGMSSVYRAVHEETGSVVAVKVLPRTLAKNVTLLQRFLREAKSAGALDHPNIVAIYDRGFDQGRHYLVLEFVEGRDLHDRVRINGVMAPDDAIRFIREVAEGLRYAAGQGMVHRDVKPANLLMTPDGHAKIIDLGLALQADDEDERVTRDGTTVGTVDYMAPEQARDSRQTSERSDIYSLGCTFYYLLTGSAPYPGGTLTDKLSRHYKAPIPDVRAHRDDVSEELSLLIRKMMEKKPDRRFADYTHLIAALDDLGKPRPTRSEEPILDALVVDDDDEEEIGLAPTEPVIGRSQEADSDFVPSTHEQYLMAEIVDEDDDDDDDPFPTLPTSKRPPASPPKKVAPDEFSLAELAELDAVDDEPGQRSSGRRPSPASSTTVRSSGQATNEPRIPATSLQAIIEEDEEEEIFGAEGAPRRGGDELPLKTWIAAGVLIGLSLAIVGFGAFMVISWAKPVKDPEVVNERTPLEVAPPELPEEAGPSRRPTGPSRPTGPAPRPPVATTPSSKFPSTPVPSKPEPVQPTEVAIVPAGPPPEESKYADDLEARLFPEALALKAPVAERTKVLLRRAIEAGTEPQTPSLAAALTRAVDVVEIVDTGPFFEDDCQVTGKTKLIRGREGIRPMIRIDYSDNPIVKEQAAKVILGGARTDHLVLEGLDIAVDVRELPDQQNALFLCQGADLTLRDCSLTVVNANDSNRGRRFSIFRVEEGIKPNRITLERTTIRGPVRTLFDVGAARASIVLDRSLVISDGGAVIVFENNEKAARTITFHRSLIASRGPILEIPGQTPHPTVRSLGSTFAKVEGASGSPMIVARSAFSGEPSTVLDWSGEGNEFAGWSGWMASSLTAGSRVMGVDQVRANWPGSDATSHDSNLGWPATVLSEDVVPEDLVAYAPDRRGTLYRIARPHPRLKELTLGSLAKLTVPELSASMLPSIEAVIAARPALPPPVAPSPVGPRAASPLPSPNATGPRQKAATPGPNKPNPRPAEPLNLTFNVTEAPWSGDLGAFLAEKLVEGTFRATVQIRGTGIFAMSPVKLPDGFSIGLFGEGSEGSKSPMATFVPKPGVAGRSMIEIHGGDLAIANMAFATDGANRPLHWIYAEDSLLALRHCRFREPGASTAGVGPLIAFVARSSRPIPLRVGPLASATNRPTAHLKNCLIWTGGEAITAEVGRGALDLENCLIISGGPAITLLPQKVAREAFEADLTMDHCTIAVDRTSVLLGPWPGDPAGPSRPWLVSTRRCVFPKTQVGMAGALLQVDPDAMARGTLFWQSVADDYDLARFLAPVGAQPSPLPPADLKRQWVDLWGRQHAKTDQGPNPRRNDPILRYKDKEKPKAGKAIPTSLELDPKSHKEEGVDFKNLPVAPRN